MLIVLFKYTHDFIKKKQQKIRQMNNFFV